MMQNQKIVNCDKSKKVRLACGYSKKKVCLAKTRFDLFECFEPERR